MVFHVSADDPLGPCLHLPKAAVRFPVEWRAPPGFQLDDPTTWPRLDGRLEYVDGKVRYMPPCGGVQQDVASDVTGILWAWSREHPEFVVGSNEAGMIIGETVRGADAAVWRRTEPSEPTGFRRSPPVLAVEIAGQDEDEAALREKAAWYLGVGVQSVWLVLPDSREVIVLDGRGELRLGKRGSIPEHSSLPGLQASVAELFRQIDQTT